MSLYTEINFRTKKALKDAIDQGHKIRAFQPGPFNKNFEKSCTKTAEGPHYPEPHRWYAVITLDEHGFIVKVK